MSNELKIFNDKLRDLLRCSIITQTPEESIELVDYFINMCSTNHNFELIRIKNMFNTDDDRGS